MNDIGTTTLQAIHDALALRGIQPAGGGFMRTASPTTYMDRNRHRIAEEVARSLPKEVDHANAPLFVKQMAAIVMKFKAAAPAATEEPAGEIRLLT